jgi:hypothetical protein
LVVLSGSAIPLISVSARSDASATSVVTVDVCNIQSHGINAGSDVPFVCECPCRFFPVSFSGLHETLNSPMSSFLSVFSRERPPEA